jgi:hypothetical protein
VDENEREVREAEAFWGRGDQPTTLGDAIQSVAFWAAVVLIVFLLLD